MSLRSRVNKNPGQNSNRRLYVGAFTKHSHRLVSLGYELTRPTVDRTTKEEVITSRIVHNVTALIESKEAAPWTKHYTVMVNHPQPHPTREGNKEPRIDIEIRGHRGTPRPRYHFEAKRLLTNSHPVGDYLGGEGLGRFLVEDYAASGDEGGMLGYVQCDTCEKWADKIKESILEEWTEHRLDQQEGWTELRLIKEFEHTYRTVHTRQNLGRITIYHTLLLFCDQVSR